MKKVNWRSQRTTSIDPIEFGKKNASGEVEVVLLMTVIRTTATRSATDFGQSLLVSRSRTRVILVESFLSPLVFVYMWKWFRGFRVWKK
ncbi:hypothetical protein L596_017204 [Steinernema carpocapsae]|uniref:Transmembrane protein n=1 Tax=Steinernema carpocapsae TaxID=34508 RepID=A0A4U5N174_STECR|nr:hypothetical protein L596_017204 [Steinernema carpocapsae]